MTPTYAEMGQQCLPRRVADVSTLTLWPLPPSLQLLPPLPPLAVSLVAVLLVQRDEADVLLVHVQVLQQAPRQEVREAPLA